ncbi:translation initiation factor IF-2-like [Phodopus roborovskii]|uniref:translation initiation factor IF-2-like n=1 Tax=Phodopus roborovskii TaxID=109678 RepID=UPI0021E3E330|nr:translation initiation factor IF-2-like [Phodopus roborovskii]
MQTHSGPKARFLQLAGLQYLLGVEPPLRPHLPYHLLAKLRTAHEMPLVCTGCPDKGSGRCGRRLGGARRERWDGRGCRPRGGGEGPSTWVGLGAPRGPWTRGAGSSPALPPWTPPAPGLLPGPRPQPPLPGGLRVRPCLAIGNVDTQEPGCRRARGGLELQRDPQVCAWAAPLPPDPEEGPRGPLRADGGHRVGAGLGARKWILVPERRAECPALASWIINPAACVAGEGGTGLGATSRAGSGFWGGSLANGRPARPPSELCWQPQPSQKCPHCLT